jgi:teichuronic acid biosynthesis glycosyltransferase TuaC
MDAPNGPASLRWARYILRQLERSRLVTWERRDDDARLLMITNLWPDSRRPAYGPFVEYTVEGIRDQGVACDVLYVRGYRGKFAYLAGALAAFVMPWAYPGKYLLVHCHGGETALAGRFFWGAPVLASYLGTDLLGTQVGGDLRLRAKCWLRSFVLRRHAALMSATTTKSAEMETLLARRARQRNTVISDGVDRKRFYPRDRDQARADLQWPLHRTIILFAGRAESPEKRIWLAEEAVDLARNQGSDIELRIANGIPPNQMPLYYAAADCLLHTSASEGSPNVVKEALACDLPVVATAAGDVRELLEGVRECVVCEPDANTIAKVLADIAHRGQRSDGWRLTEHLGTESIAKRTLQFYSVFGFPISSSHL